MADSPEASSVSIQANGGSRPVPDPTALTDAAIAKAIEAMRDYVDGQLAVRDERLNGIDTATSLRLATIDHIPARIDEKVATLAGLTVERFAGVDTRFLERDTRSERESRDNKVAVDAAFAAQKEAAAKQDEANAKAIDKSEKATAETIKTNQELSSSKTDALTKGLDEVKIAISRIESIKTGATESRTGLYAAIGVAATLVFLAIAVIGFMAMRLPA